MPHRHMQKWRAVSCQDMMWPQSRKGSISDCNYTSAIVCNTVIRSSKMPWIFFRVIMHLVFLTILFTNYTLSRQLGITLAVPKNGIEHLCQKSIQKTFSVCALMARRHSQYGSFNASVCPDVGFCPLIPEWNKFSSLLFRTLVYPILKIAGRCPWTFFFFSSFFFVNYCKKSFEFEDLCWLFILMPWHFPPNWIVSLAITHPIKPCLDWQQCVAYPYPME